MNSIEQWRPVVGYEGCYEVSDHGCVRSVARTIMRSNGRPQRIRERIISQHHRGQRRNRKNPYLSVTLIRDGEYQGLLVHRLILESFVGPCPVGMEACHSNDISDDNRLENLRWDTPSANRHDQLRNGGHPNSKKTHCKRNHEFTAENTRWMRRKDGNRWRRCVTCANVDQLERYHRKRGEQR